MNCIDPTRRLSMLEMNLWPQDPDSPRAPLDSISEETPLLEEERNSAPAELSLEHLYREQQKEVRQRLWNAINACDPQIENCSQAMSDFCIFFTPDDAQKELTKIAALLNRRICRNISNWSRPFAQENLMLSEDQRRERKKWAEHYVQFLLDYCTSLQRMMPQACLMTLREYLTQFQRHLQSGSYETFPLLSFQYPPDHQQIGDFNPQGMLYNPLD